MTDRFDVIVIGGGSAGLVSSGILAGLGARVAVVEKDDLGGECLFTGCVPSKALIAAAASRHAAGRAPDHGLPPVEMKAVDFRSVRAAIGEAIDAVYSGPEALLEEGVEEVLIGRPRFVDTGSIDVEGRRLRARRFVLCTGSRPRLPDLPGLDGVPFLTSRSVLELDRLPDRLAIVGTGPVGCEMAQVFRRLGSRVTLLGRSTGLLPRDDPELTQLLLEQFLEEGIVVLPETEAAEVSQGARGEIAIHARRRGEDMRIQADALLLAVGRSPNVEDLGLERVGVEYGPGGITVDRHLRTTARNVWALGDVTGLTPFSHMAEAQARAVARHIGLGIPASFDLGQRVWGTFTDPELARVGLDEESARRVHRRVEVLRLDLSEIDRAQADKRLRGRAKIVVAGWRGKVVGAHLLAPHAGELIQEWILACRHGLRIDQVSNAVHVYPSWSMLNQRAADTRFRGWGRSPRWRGWARRIHAWTSPLRR